MTEAKENERDWLDGSDEDKVFGLQMMDQNGKTYEIAATISCPACQGRTFAIVGGRECDICRTQWEASK